MFMEGVTDGGVEALCRGGLLTCLVLRHNHAACLTGKSVAAIARCRGLRDLRIGFLSALSGCDLGPLASCHRLRSVDATLCSGLGDAMASLLALPELSRLSLTSSLPPFARPADDAVARCGRGIRTPVSP